MPLAKVFKITHFAPATVLFVSSSYREPIGVPVGVGERACPQVPVLLKKPLYSCVISYCKALHHQVTLLSLSLDYQVLLLFITLVTKQSGYLGEVDFV